MAGRIPNAWMDDLYNRADIVQVVSDYVHLKKDGKRFWGLCPFHNEKTPSFSVNPELNLYYCFGCKAGGNAVNFVMETEHMTFSEAALFLGEKFHMPPPTLNQDPDYEKKKTQRERLINANTEAARFYHNLLWTEEGKKVLDYFHGRGMDDSVIRKFGLGASPDKWDALLRHLKDLGYSEEELVLAGLVLKKEDRCFDMFRSRAMFPIIDVKGTVLGFGGRILDNGKPKYMNTGDTPVYNKRQGVFAANLLKKERELKRILLVEGYMDVVALTQMGIKGVVASLGTSLTPEQAKLLHRFAPEVWVAYDGDEPGQHAIEKAIGIFNSEEMPLKVLRIPDRLDPDEYIRQRGKQAFEDLRPITSTRFLLERTMARFDLTDTDGKMECAKACSGLLAKVTSPVEMENYIEYLHVCTGFSKEALYAQVGVSRPAVKEQRVVMGDVVKRSRNSLKQDDECDKAQQMMLSLITMGVLPENLRKPGLFDNPLYAKCAELLMDGMKVTRLLDQFDDPQEKELLTKALSMQGEMDAEEAAEIARDCLRKISMTRLEKQIGDLRTELQVCDPSASPGILNQIMTLSKELNSMKNQIWQSGF